MKWQRVGNNGRALRYGMGLGRYSRKLRDKDSSSFTVLTKRIRAVIALELSSAVPSHFTEYVLEMLAPLALKRDITNYDISKAVKKSVIDALKELDDYVNSHDSDSRG